MNDAEHDEEELEALCAVFGLDSPEEMSLHDDVRELARAYGAHLAGRAYRAALADAGRWRTDDPPVVDYYEVTIEEDDGSRRVSRAVWTGADVAGWSGQRVVAWRRGLPVWPYDAEAVAA